MKRHVSMRRRPVDRPTTWLRLQAAARRDRESRGRGNGCACQGCVPTAPNSLSSSTPHAPGAEALTPNRLGYTQSFKRGAVRALCLDGVWTRLDAQPPSGRGCSAMACKILPPQHHNQPPLQLTLAHTCYMLRTYMAQPSRYGWCLVAAAPWCRPAVSLGAFAAAHAWPHAV